MRKSITEIVGGNFRGPRSIPGISKSPTRKFRYVEGAPETDGVDHFQKLIGQIGDNAPNIGGIICEACRFTLPNGRIFYAYSFNRDLDGWRATIDASAAALGSAVGWIKGEAFITSDGLTTELKDIDIAFI